MPTAKSLLLAVLAAFALGYGLLYGLAVVRARRARQWQQDPERIDEAGDARAPGMAQVLLGLVTNFFDSLGIGSFAPTTSAFKLLRMVPDERIPGTLNVGHTLPTMVQAAVFMTIVEVDATTLVSMIGASVLGAWLGAGVVSRWPRRKVQVGMGLALTVAAVLMLMTNLSLFPGGGAALGLGGTRLAIAIAANFALGALMTLGIGLYAPCMIVVSLLGMDPRAAFPIMMGSCAFLMPVGSARFLRTRRYSLRPALGLTVGGIPGVLAGALLVTSLAIGTVRWLVVAVVLYTAWSMLRSAHRERGVAASPAASEVI